MKVKNIVKEMYAAIFAGDKQKERELWFKALKKSLKHKKTQAIR